MIGRYLVFGHADYYPNGGWNDLKGSANTLEEAQAIITHASDHEARYEEWDEADYRDRCRWPPSEDDEFYVVDLATGTNLGDPTTVIERQARENENLRQIITDLRVIMKREGWQG